MKVIIRLLLFLLMIICANAVIAQEPIARWKMTESSGVVVKDSVGQWNGIINGKYLWAIDAPYISGINRSLLLGGKASDYVDISTSSDFSPKSITVSVWAKAMGNHAGQSLVAKYSSWPGSYELLFESTGILCWRVWDNNSSWEKWVGKTAKAPYTYKAFKDSKWHHFVGTVDKVTGAATLYVDGMIIEKLNLTPNSGLRTTNHTLSFGRRPYIGSECSYNGRLGNVAIYNTALTQAQIAELRKDNQARVNPGFYGWLGDFHEVTGAYPTYYDREYFKSHNANWFWLGHQWVLPYLLTDSCKVREAMTEFKGKSRIWYEAFWWGDHSKWADSNNPKGFGAGNIPAFILAKLTTAGIQSGGDNILGKTWIDVADDPAVMASVKKTIAWQLDNIFRVCGNDALYGVVLSEEEPDVSVYFNGLGQEGYTFLETHKAEIQLKMTRAFNELYDFVKARYPWLKVAPGAYPAWVQKENLKKDAVLMDLYPAPGNEEADIQKWIDAWGQDLEHYILLWGYGDMSRKMEIERFDKITNGLLNRGFKNIGYFHPKLTLEDRIYRLFDVSGIETSMLYNLRLHTGRITKFVADTETIANKLDLLIGQKMPVRPVYSKESYLSRDSIVELTDDWYAFREKLLDDAYDKMNKLREYQQLSFIADILYAEGFIPESAKPDTKLTPSEILNLDKLSKEYQSLPAFYTEYVPLESKIFADMNQMAGNISMRANNGFSAELIQKITVILNNISTALNNHNCVDAYSETLALYNELRQAHSDRSWRLSIVLGNPYGYPLSVQANVSVVYADGKVVAVKSDRPFESSSGSTAEWIIYLPTRPSALIIGTGAWSGDLNVNSLDISTSTIKLVPTSTADVNHVKGLDAFLAGSSPGFILSPWDSASGVRINY